MTKELDISTETTVNGQSAYVTSSEGAVESDDAGVHGTSTAGLALQSSQL